MGGVGHVAVVLDDEVGVGEDVAKGQGDVGREGGEEEGRPHREELAPVLGLQLVELLFLKKKRRKCVLLCTSFCVNMRAKDEDMISGTI